MGWKKLFSNFTQGPLIFTKCKVPCKYSHPEIFDKYCLIGIFFGCNFRKLLSYLKSALSNENEKFQEKKKKIPDSKSLVWIFLGKNLKKVIVIF